MYVLWQTSKLDQLVIIQQVAINNHEPQIDDTTHLFDGSLRANSKIPLFRGPAASLHGLRNGKQFVELHG
jgi:hypothetical protein